MLDLNGRLLWMAPNHLDQVLAIEHESFEYPWGPKDFKRALQHHDFYGMVATHGHSDSIMGYVVLRRTCSNLDVCNLAVEEGARRNRIGTALIASARDISRRSRMVADVRESNVSAQLFFRALGFRVDRIVPDAYELCDDAAYRFESGTPAPGVTFESVHDVRR